MSIWDTDTAVAPTATKRSDFGSAPSFAETFAAAQKAYNANDLSTTRNYTAGQIGSQIVRDLKKRGYTGYQTPQGTTVGFRDDVFRTDKTVRQQLGIDPADNAYTLPHVYRALAAEQARDPSFYKDITGPDSFEAAIIAHRKRVYDVNNEILGRATGVGGFLASTAGSIVEAVQDPLQIGIGILTAPAGGPAYSLAAKGLGVTAASGLARKVAVGAVSEFGVNAVATIPTLPVKASHSAEIDIDYGAGDAAIDTLIGGAAGSVLHVGGKVAVATPRALLIGLEKLKRPLTPVERDAATVLRAEAELHEATPFADTAEGDAAHGQAMATALAAVDAGARVPPVAQAPLKPPPRAPDLESFAPAELKTDAARFQFKAGGDSAGVTDRLADVPEWSSVLSGKAVVWEDTGGQHWVVDGHQRHRLASRAEAAGQQDVRIDAVVLRESDGVTAEQARTWAAIKNIAEGSGTPTDAAKVLRAHGGDLPLPLPEKSAIVRDARGLAALSDDAFGMVVNEAIDPAFGALIGRLAPDRPDVHASLVQLLERLDVPTRTQAESIVRQALALPVIKETQFGLFGAEEVTRNLFVERARVLDAAGRRLRNDKRVFATLVGEADTITAAGNRLDKAANKGKAQSNAQALDLLSALAHRPGPISDALGRAAEQLARGGSLGSLARSFVDELSGLDLRAALDDAGGVGRGAADGELAGGAGRAGDAVEAGDGAAVEDAAAGLFDAADTARSNAALAGFDDPHGSAAKEQLDSLDHDARFELEQQQSMDPAGADPIAANRAAFEAAGGKVGPHGPIHDELAGDYPAAIAQLAADADGEVPGVLSHPDIGPIDLVWGEPGTGRSDGRGLAKLLAYHPEVVRDLPAIIEAMPIKSRNATRIQLESPTHKAAVRLDFDGERKTWLLTAFEKETAPAAAVDRRAAADDQAGSPGPGQDADIIDLAGGDKNAVDPRAAALERERLQLAADAPARAKVAQADLSDTGLFGQKDMFALGDGAPEPLGDILARHDADQAALDAMKGCL